jgi:hypothetical protein
VFYVIVFSLLAVLLVIAGVTAITRNRRQLEAEDYHSSRTADTRKQNKAKRTQSRNARRKR